MSYAILIGGLLFPLISWISLALSAFLCSHTGRQRQVAPAGAGFVVTDSGATDDYGIDGMQLLRISD
ncbi:hypothetical protein ASD58_23175 [Duganella sp. Root1480D1]|nr:hypothetical protein ASD58_23175 [Duganella sp. Root1480D1]